MKSDIPPSMTQWTIDKDFDSIFVEFFVDRISEVLMHRNEDFFQYQVCFVQEYLTCNGYHDAQCFRETEWCTSRCD